ncbi:MAG: G-D-S-L family lipolytic protein [Chitinophagaceae bacterium]|nr:MAG: G-D-S-L family lipolytic protein [Chitinophagaceae bacterium]
MNVLLAQEQPFIKEINYFKKLDSTTAIPKKPILFIGSSSFTNWKDVQQYYPGYTILNRAFGGSSLPHQILYAEDVIFKYKPKQVVIYCGENDLTGGDHITADSIVTRFKRLHTLIRKKLPKTSIVYVSMKPSPSREKYLPVMKDANAQIKDYISKKKKTAYVDVFSAMLNSDGSIKSEIFLSDRLHMNRQGYQIWKPILEPYLMK